MLAQSVVAALYTIMVLIYFLVARGYVSVHKRSFYTTGTFMALYSLEKLH